ncbi:MAG: YeeE/YedE family protein, partial [Burkholderiales bacterium]|nr:YeeE/YedE family protein [Burkholderiales bacterium]
LLLFRFVLRRPHPLFAAAFHLPKQAAVDRRLVAGAAVFGVGWGLAGYCPGPALAGLGIASTEALWFVPAMLAGMLLYRLFDRLR